MLPAGKHTTFIFLADHHLAQACLLKSCRLGLLPQPLMSSAAHQRLHGLLNLDIPGATIAQICAARVLRHAYVHDGLVCQESLIVCRWLHLQRVDICQPFANGDILINSTHLPPSPQRPYSHGNHGSAELGESENAQQPDYPASSCCYNCGCLQP